MTFIAESLSGLRGETQRDIPCNRKKSREPFGRYTLVSLSQGVRRCALRRRRTLRLLSIAPKRKVLLLLPSYFGITGFFCVLRS
jgi:hypothetical protein